MGFCYSLDLVGVNISGGFWQVRYELNMVVKYRCLQLGDSARISRHKMTWYSFDLDTTCFYLDALYVMHYHSALFFWSLLYILITSVFFVWSSVIIFSLCLLLSMRSPISNFPCLPLFQLTLRNSVKLEIGYFKEGLFSSLVREELSPPYVLVFHLLIRDHSCFPFSLSFSAISSLGFFTKFLSSCWPITCT